MFDRPFFLSFSTARRHVDALPPGRFSTRKFLLLSIFLLAQALITPLNAEWGRTAEDYIRLPLYRDAYICSDGNGGCWATGEGVGLSHVDRNGNLTWGDEPFFLLPSGGYNPRPVLADNGDVIIGMDIYSDEDNLPDVYLQRVNLDQEFLWGENGVKMDTSSRKEWILDVKKGPLDDTYLIQWATRSDRDREMDLRLQLINGDGDLLWGRGGIGLNRSLLLTFLSNVVVSSDQYIIAVNSFWESEDDEDNLEIQKIDSDGELLFRQNYAIVGGDLHRLLFRDVESDRSGGVVLIYESERREDNIRYFAIKAMRISGDGDSLWTRQLYERAASPEYETFGRIYPILNYAGSGHFFIAWADYPHTFQVVALDIDGEVMWEEPVNINDTLTAAPIDAVDSQDGVCYVWRDSDQAREVIIQQWGQRINIAGERLWGDRGRAIQARSLDRFSIATDGNGGVITVVELAPTVQMINRNGEIGVVLETSVKEDKRKSLNLSPQLFIYPNPGNTHFRIEYDTGIPNELLNYGIYNLLGRTIRTGAIRGGHTVINDLSPFSSGEYILRIQSPRQTVSTRFLLVK